MYHHDTSVVPTKKQWVLHTMGTTTGVFYTTAAVTPGLDRLRVEIELTPGIRAKVKTTKNGTTKFQGFRKSREHKGGNCGIFPSLVTSATSSLCRSVFRAFMMRTTAASVRCLLHREETHRQRMADERRKPMRAASEIGKSRNMSKHACHAFTYTKGTRYTYTKHYQTSENIWSCRLF